MRDTSTYRWIVIELNVVILARILGERMTKVEVIASFVAESE